MLQATIARIDDEDVARLRVWLDALPSRRAEVAESYERHGTRHELFLLIHTRPGPILIFVAEVDDDEQAARSFLLSNLPIDVEFKQLVQAMEPEAAQVELLYDSSEFVGLADS